MNSIKSLVYPVVALLAIASAVTAHAETPTPDDSATQAWAQVKTRPQVQAELFQARADGSIRVHSISYNPLAVARSLRTRAEVHAEAVAANRSGADQAWFGEDSGSFELARLAPRRNGGRVVAAR
jgi:hypothetical protein